MEKEEIIASLTAQLSEANANFSEARTTANLYYQNIQAKEEIITALTAQLSEARKEVERLKIELQDYRDDYSSTAKEVCQDENKDDRVHCTCVPSLRAIIKNTTALLEASKGRERRLVEALTIAQWGDGQSGCCQICDAYKPEPHKEGCVIGLALAEGKGEE